LSLHRWEDRGAEGAEGDRVWRGSVPLHAGVRGWGGAVPPPQKIFVFLISKMVSFCAFRVVLFTV